MFGFGKNKTALLFQKVVFYAFMGVIVGILLGLGFGFFIGLVTDLIGGASMQNVIPMGTFFGMGAGAILGSTFGGVVGYNK